MKLRLEVAIGTTVGRRAEIRQAIRILQLIERAMKAEDRLLSDGEAAAMGHVCGGRTDPRLPEPWPDSCDCKTGPTFPPAREELQ